MYAARDSNKEVRRQIQVAQSNSPGDCYARRGNGRKQATGEELCTNKAFEQ